MTRTDIVLAVASLAFASILAFASDRSLLARGVRPWARLLAVLPLAAGVVFGVATKLNDGWIFPAGVVAMFVLWLTSPRWIVRIPAAQWNPVGLAETVVAAQAHAESFLGQVGPPSDGSVRRLRAIVSRADRYRDTSTAEYIDLFSAEMSHFLTGSPWPEMEKAQSKMARIERAFQREFAAAGIKGPARLWTRRDDPQTK